MSIGPILPGRLPVSLTAARLREHLQASGLVLQRLQDQIGSGQKFFLPSDAPAAALRTIILQKAVERKEQMQANLAVSRSMLSATETALADVSTALNRAKSFALAAVGESATAAEREAMAVETRLLVEQVLGAANARFRGRYLFGGSRGTEPPFERVAGTYVRYNGDGRAVQSFADLGLLLANNVDGKTAFGATTAPVGSDLNPALTDAARLSDLLGGRGIVPGLIVVTLDDPALPAAIQRTVDLSAAETIGDLRRMLEHAFAGEAVTLSVDIDPATNAGLRVSASSGTVSVRDVLGSTLAAELGIASGPAATILGGDLDPRLTRLTPLDALHGGSGISRVPGQGLLITNGGVVTAVDISSPAIQTVEDLFNALAAADPHLELEINSAGNGLAVSSRLSGTRFSIGENGGTTAADLGLRTLTQQTLLAALNLGRGVPVAVDAPGAGAVVTLSITRRDGQSVAIDLTHLKTVGEVIAAIDADDGLAAGLNAVGNGIEITDVTGGTGSLSVQANAVAVALGIDGTTAGSTLSGRDVNPREAGGVFHLLLNLEQALRNGDDAELARLSQLIDREVDRFSVVRGSVGARLRTLEQIDNRLADEMIQLQESLSQEFDVDLTEAITQIAQQQGALQALLQVTGTTLQLSLFSFI